MAVARQCDQAQTHTKQGDSQCGNFKLAALLQSGALPELCYQSRLHFCSFPACPTQHSARRIASFTTSPTVGTVPSLPRVRRWIEVATCTEPRFTAETRTAPAAAGSFTSWSSTAAPGPSIPSTLLRAKATGLFRITARWRWVPTVLHTEQPMRAELATRASSLT